MPEIDEFKRELEDYFCRFTFGQFVTLILLEIVTLFFVFYLGSRYGADMLGGRSVDQAKTESTLPKQPTYEAVKGPDVDYTYPQVLTGPEGQKSIRVKPSGISAEEMAKKEKEKEAPAVEVTREVTREQPEEVSLEGEGKVIEEVKPVQRTEVSKKIGGRPTGQFTIQVGSYPVEEEASGEVLRWKEAGYSSFLSVGKIPEKGTWYRVRIGGFATRKEAEQFLKKLKARDHKVSGLVVPSKS